jgi:plastocyanin
MFPLSIQRILKIFGLTLAVPLSLVLTLTALLDLPTAQAQHHMPLMPGAALAGRSSPAGRPSPLTPTDPAAPSGMVDVSISSFTFNPAVITVTAGATVRWTNADPVTHTTTSDIGSLDPWNSGQLGPGGIFTKTFATPGTYSYHCAIHPSMLGTIVVIQEPSLTVTLAGPLIGVHAAAYSFVATVDPISAALPITFSWEATNQLPVTHVNTAVSDTQVFSWAVSLLGAQWITVTARNAAGSALDTHLILIDPSAVYLPIIMSSIGP